MARGAMARALVVYSVVLARLACRCHAFFAAGIGSTNFVPALRAFDARALGSPVTTNANREYAADCRRGVLAGGSARRRRASTASFWAPSPSSTAAATTPLSMMAGECVGGTDISRVLFVCLYNIMTSPCAEGCLNKKILDEFGVFEEGEETWEVGSCSTGGGSPDWYKEGGVTLFEGQEPDVRVEIAAAQRRITTRGLHLKKGGGVRPLTPSDLDKFDVILGIDDDNVAAIMAAAEHWGKADLAAKKTRSLLSYCTEPEFREVEKIPNPYFAGRNGFEHLVDVIQHAVDNLFEKCLKGEALSYD